MVLANGRLGHACRLRRDSGAGRMKARRLMARLLLPLAIWYAVILPRQAFAGLPIAMIFAAEVATPVFVRALGGTVVQRTLLAAANDAAFATEFASWQTGAIMFGAVLFGISGNRTVWVQAHKEEPVVKNPQTDTGYYSRVVGYPYNNTTVPLDAIATTRDDALEIFSQRIVQLNVFSHCRRGQTTDASGSVNWAWVEKPELTYDYGFIQCKATQDDWSSATNYQVNVDRISKQYEKRDGTLRVLRVDGGFKADATDPDWNNGWIDSGIGNASGSYPNFNNIGAVELIMPSSNADTVEEAVVEIAPYGDGVQLRTSDPIEDPDTGSPTTTVKAVRTNPAGVPQTVEQYSYPGVPADAPRLTDPAPTMNPGTNPADAGNANFPSDYARRGEVGSGVDRLLDKGTTPTDPETDLTKFDDLFFKDVFNDLLAWRLPANSGECPKPEFIFNTTTYKFEVQCTLFDDYKGAINSAMGAVWTVLALFIVMRA